MPHGKLMLSIFATILGTGAVLNLAGTGKLGAVPQRIAQYITKGYGV